MIDLWLLLAGSAALWGWLSGRDHADAPRADLSDTPPVDSGCDLLEGNPELLDDLPDDCGDMDEFEDLE